MRPRRHANPQRSQQRKRNPPDSQSETASESVNVNEIEIARGTESVSESGRESGIEIEAEFQRMLPPSQRRHDPALAFPPAPAIAGPPSRPGSQTRRRGHGR